VSGLNLSTQLPDPSQLSAASQSTLESLPQGVLTATGVWLMTPVAGTHESLVHALLSSIAASGVPSQVPPLQMSPVVQALLSLQFAVLFGCVTSPVVVLQRSSVQMFPSDVFIGVPRHVPDPQMSPVVQALLSLQFAVLFGCVTSPVVVLQRSSVQMFPSDVFIGVPLQLPLPLQASV
jgi:hypothetical protein